MLLFGKCSLFYHIIAACLIVISPLEIVILSNAYGWGSEELTEFNQGPVLHFLLFPNYLPM